MQQFNRESDNESLRLKQKNTIEEGGSDKVADIYIGTAGYSYAHWRGDFYPRKTVTQSEELRYFSGVFPAVEINSSFHAIPRKETLDVWAQKVKAGFSFSFKVPQEITHERRLENIVDPWNIFIERLMKTLISETAPNNNDDDNGPEKYSTEKKTMLGPILFQLPPSLHKDASKLDVISKLVSDVSKSNARIQIKLRIAFEFRHKSWYCDEVYETMNRHGFGLCENISPDNSTLRVNNEKAITAINWHYIRFHKESGERRLLTNYTIDQLKPWADILVKRRFKNIVQYCFFLNDYEGHGPRNAKALMKLVKEKSSTKTSSFVKNWKPDPVTPSIQSLFQKPQSMSQHVRKSPVISNLSESSLSPINTSKLKETKTINSENNIKSRNESRSIDSFFQPNTNPSAKRQKLSRSPRPSKKYRKGAIDTFFATKTSK